ncbi:uncharacterized protein LOC127010023 isoform X2 [Eriocheir sinensis]|uniref:uncharacterized protein LOC127010023 isoform X2 n=1 Tax=Eriocheir sinensis TaxID=95602 RepID=UPI0021C5E276|nr:uncharacterized protein LOC127010023 isoform X2 [Eriocheir sinensis]
MPHCVVVGCNTTNRYRQTKYRFFHFPNDTETSERWLQLCGRPDITKPVHHRICCLHFEPSAYQRNLKYELLGQPVPDKQIRLKPEAVPTLRLPSTGTAGSPAKGRRAILPENQPVSSPAVPRLLPSLCQPPHNEPRQPRQVSGITAPEGGPGGTRPRRGPAMEEWSSWEFCRHRRDSSAAAAGTNLQHPALGLAGHEPPNTAMWGAGDETTHYREPFEGVCARRQDEGNDSDESSCILSLPDLMKDYGEVGDEGTTNDTPLPVLPSDVEGNSAKGKSHDSQPVLPDLTEGERTNSDTSMTVLPSGVEGDTANSPNSPPVLPTDTIRDSSDWTNLNSSMTVLPSSVEGGTAKINSSNSLPMLPTNFMEGASIESNTTTLLTVLPTYTENNTQQCNSLISLPVLPTHITEGESDYRNSPSVLPSQAVGDSDHGNSANSYPVLPAKESDSKLTNNPTSVSVLPNHSAEGDGEQIRLTRPLLSVLSTSLMENNSNQTSNPTSLPVLPKPSTEGNREQDSLTRPLLSVLSTSLLENTAQARNISCPSSQSLIHRLLADGKNERSKLNRTLSAPSSNHAETDSDQSTGCPSLASSLHGLPYNLTEDISNQSNRSATLPVSPPLTPQPSSSQHTTSASQSPALPSSEPQTFDSSHYHPKRKRRKNSDGTDVGLNMASEDSPPPPYSYCIASAVENILIDCPEDVRQECGQQILTAAMKILVEMKKEEESSVALME